MRRAILLVSLLAAPALLAAQVRAQAKAFESPQGFRLKLPRAATEETRDPKDRIVLGKFLVEVDKTRCAFWVARYRTKDAAVTGGGEGGGDGGAAPQSLKDQATAAYNDAHSLQGLLDLR